MAACFTGRKVQALPAESQAPATLLKDDWAVMGPFYDTGRFLAAPYCDDLLVRFHRIPLVPELVAISRFVQFLQEKVLRIRHKG